MKKTNEKLIKYTKNKILWVGIILLVIIIIAVFQNKKVETKDNTQKLTKENTVVKENTALQENVVVNEEKNEELDKINEIIKNDSSGYLQLVNKDNAAMNIDIKNDLVIPKVNLVAPKGNEKNLIRKEVAKALEEMLNDAKEKERLNIFLNSGYRSTERQIEVYNAEIINDKNQGKNYVARPGYSEHQTGLAVDLTCRAIKFKIEEKFEETNEGKWVMNNAHNYGFILRYPKGKENETGYSYEPWHYRYVGKEVSMYIKKENLTLEELYHKVKK